MNTFLLYGPLVLLGLLILVGVGALSFKFGNAFVSIKKFFEQLLGSIAFYLLSLAIAYAAGKVLEYVVHPIFLGDLPTGIDNRLMLAPGLYFLLGLGSLHILMPDTWATSKIGSASTWVIVAGMLLIGLYALGIFPPVSMWTSDSFLGLDPWWQGVWKWVFPPVYPGVTGFADGC